MYIYTQPSIADATVTPTDVTRLNTPPYNRFSLNCTVGITPTTNMYNVTYSWPQEDTYGDGNVMNNELESTLTVNLNDSLLADTHMYTCTATVTITGATGTAMPTDSATVTVKGIVIYPIY